MPVNSVLKKLSIKAAHARDIAARECASRAQVAGNRLFSDRNDHARLSTRWREDQR